jgi:uncharacterized protein YjiS (DUF1127 family)
MSCGSTPCNPTNTLDTASPSFRGLRWSWKIPLAWLEGRYQRRQLHELDDHLLADIGVPRTAAEEVRRSPLYLIAWRDSR